MKKKTMTVEDIDRTKEPVHRVKKPTAEDLAGVGGPKDYKLSQVPHVREVGNQKITVFSTHRDYSKRAKMQREQAEQAPPPTFEDVMVALKGMAKGMENLGDSMMKMNGRITAIEGKVEVPGPTPVKSGEEQVKAETAGGTAGNPDANKPTTTGADTPKE